MLVKKSCENPNVVYICLFGRRLIFYKDGRTWRYHGWYAPNRKSTI